MRKGEHRDAERGILGELGKYVAEHGFSSKPVGQSFYREISGGLWALHVSFIRHRTDLDITPDVALRIDAIETIVNRCDISLTEVEKRRSMTLGIELGNLLQKQPLRWTVSEIDDVPTVAVDIARAFEQIGLPYLVANSVLESAYHLLRSSAPEDRMHSPLLGPRCMRAIAAAHVLGRTDEFVELVHQCGARLVDDDDLYLEEFRCLVQSLSSHQ